MATSEFMVMKMVDFCYGHRLLNYNGKCKNLHGHTGQIEVYIRAGTLDELGMVVDFTKIKAVVKQWVNDNLDHRMILCRKDPLVALLQQTGEPVYLMDENPTAENIARHVYQEVKRQKFNVTEVRLWESSSSFASYKEV
jgi:6-pyruvoyltetrahydropterin/6-carboxytetrahydropterin synthase